MDLAEKPSVLRFSIPDPKTWRRVKKHPQGYSAKKIVTASIAAVSGQAHSKLTTPWTLATLGVGFAAMRTKDQCQNILRAAFAVVCQEDALFVPLAVQEEWLPFKEKVTTMFINNNVKVKQNHRNWVKNAIDKIFTTTLDDKATPMMKEVLTFLGCGAAKTLTQSITWPADFNTKEGVLFPQSSAQKDRNGQSERQVAKLVWAVPADRELILALGEP